LARFEGHFVARKKGGQGMEGKRKEKTEGTASPSPPNKFMVTAVVSQC